MIAAVTCDIIKSRQYKTAERKKVDDLIRQAFTETIKLLPEAEADKLSFSIIQGDEFQFVIGNPALAYKFVVFYRVILALKELKPKFRAGIGIGDVAIDNDNSYKMDGSAFHYSRDAFRRFAKPKFRHRITSIISGNEDLDAQFEIIAMYNDFIEQQLTEKQKEAIYWHIKGFTLLESSKKIGIAHQNVDKRIKKSNWKLISKGMQYIRELISLAVYI